MKLNNYIKSLLFKEPIYCILRVTNRCNFRCRMCNVWKQKNKELDMNQLKQLEKKMSDTNLFLLNIGGGEPLLRPDIVKIVKLFSKNFDVRMQTNGFLANEKLIKRLVKAGLKNVSISLDTLDPKQFDYICNSKNAFYKVLENIELFRKHLPGKMCILNTCVSGKNLGELRQLVTYANTVGYWSGFVPVMLSDAKTDTKYRSYAPELKADNNKLIKEKITELIEMKKKGCKIFNSYNHLEDSIKYLQGKPMEWGCNNCSAGKLYCEISPNGDVSPCSELPSFGNALEGDTLKDMFKSEHKSNVCVNCMHPCWYEATALRKPKVLLRDIPKIKSMIGL